ncbi:metallophosphoesterase [Paraglaciecola hydrolytica]|uniref:Calcineurin-like phosphoesterase domain-containing protein n=1 Tax=Paraglaciecola hydrolytica TaxID=1799789 RepID=A0A136A4V6_9ALTE|nr:metallophosphoesterase [Paraglaciecola hydrolytica]KXI30263.1 hypothetical protein AX660_09780 [Paraglaciecola hydrolytica]
MIQLAQISDCHLFADMQQSAYGHINPYQSLGKVLVELVQHKLDLLLVTGDLSADGSAQSYQHFKQLVDASGITCPYVILPGNHDDIANLQQQFELEQLWLNYPCESPLTLANWQFHLLNTKTTTSNGALSIQTLVKLERALANASDHFHVIAAHHHPLPCNGWMDKHHWHNAIDFVATLSRYPAVKAMVHGHIHHASEQQIDNCNYMACPSTCWQWAMQAQFDISSQVAGYRLLQLTTNGQVATQIFRVE